MDEILDIDGNNLSEECIEETSNQKGEGDEDDSE